MKTIITTSCSAALAMILTGCGDSEGGFTSGGNNSNSNIPTAIHFSLASSEVPASVYTGTLTDAATWVWEVNHEVEISVIVGDNNNIRVSGGTVHFDTDYGLMSASTCTLSTNGTCSIKWYSEGSSQAPTDNTARITAWMMGEESFMDIDASGNFNDGDVSQTDTSEPFVDVDHDGAYTLGVDEPLDVDGNGAFTPADSLFNGLNCTHSSLCSTTTTIPVFDILILNLDARS